ncbi:MAG: SPOR domain-containing protein, partial [Pseudomonadota bacterium]
PDQIAADAAASLGHDGEGLAIADLTETLAQDAALPEPDAEALAPDASADTDLALAILPATVPGLARSSRPSQRPASLARRAAPPQTTPIEAPAAAPGTRVAGLVTAVDADPGTLLPGSRIVQVGAFDSEDAAMGEWDRLYARFRDYMDGKQRLVQKARSGGRDFWRLRVVGFDDGGDARRFCSALLAKDAPCIPVTVR